MVRTGRWRAGMGASARAERAACACAAAACLSAGEAELARCALRRLAGLGAEGRDAARRCARAAARGDAPREWAGGDAELLAWLCAAELRRIEGGVGAAAEQTQEAEPEPAEAARALEARARVRLLAERVCREVRAVDVSELQHWAEGAVLATIGGGFVSCGDAPAAALAAAACEAPSALRALALALRADAPAAAAAIDDAQAAAIERCAPIEGALAAAERLAMLGGSLSEEQWLGALRAVLLEKSEAGSAPGLSEDESVARAAIRSVAACGSERGMRCLEIVMAEATAQVSRGTGSPALVRSTSRTRRVERNVFSALESGMPYAEAQVRDAIRALADRGYDGTEGLPASLVLLAAVAAWDERRGDVDAQVRASDSAAHVLSGGAGRTGSAAVASSRALEGACEQLAHRVLAARFLCEHAERNPSSMPLDMKGALHVLESASVLAAACELAPHAPRADLLRLVSATPLGALARGDRPAADAALVCSSAALAAAARLSAGMRASRALTTGNAQALTLEIERSLGALRVPAMRTWVLKLVCVIVLMEAEDKADIDVNAESRTGTSVGPATDALAVLRQLFAMLNAQLQTLPGGAGRASAKAGADDTGGHGGLDAILQGKGMEGLEERAQPRSAGDRAAGADAGDSDKDAGSVLFFSSEWEAASAARRVELADKFEDVAWRIQLMGELPAPISNEGHTRVQRSDASQEWDWRGAVAMLRASPGDLVGLCTRHGRYDLANEVARHCNLPEADRSALQLKRWVDGVTSAAAVGNSEGVVWGDGEGAAPLDIAGAGVAVSDAHAAALCLGLAAAVSSDGDLCVHLLQQAHAPASRRARARPQRRSWTQCVRTVAASERHSVAIGSRARWCTSSPPHMQAATAARLCVRRSQTLTRSLRVGGRRNSSRMHALHRYAQRTLHPLAASVARVPRTTMTTGGEQWARWMSRSLWHSRSRRPNPSPACTGGWHNSNKPLRPLGARRHRRRRQPKHARPPPCLHRRRTGQRGSLSSRTLRLWRHSLAAAGCGRPSPLQTNGSRLGRATTRWRRVHVRPTRSLAIERVRALGRASTTHALRVFR